MVSFSLETRSKHLNAELSTKFCGNAKIALNQLAFDSDEEPDEKKTDHLQRVFKRVGCDRLNPNHFIPGNISEGVLEASLQQSNRNADDLRSLEPPELRLPAGQHVQCLGGRHRVLALRKHNPSATWWPVKLYVDLSREVCRALAEESANEGKSSDGEIVANILSYPEHSVEANQWWARLDKSKPRILKNILRHPGLAPAFKMVIAIPGLRPGLLLATWNKIFHCVEEVTHHLQLIHKTWVRIMGSAAALDFVDSDAVRELESRVPGISYCDERHAEIEIRKEAIFKAVIDGDQRELILQNLKQVEHLIPSIRTLQEDFKYLRPCTQVMRKLVSNKEQIPVTVRTMACYAFSADEGPSVNREARFLTNLKLLYLRIMQNVCQLSRQPPLQADVDEEDYELLPYDATTWHELALRAKELGFSSDEILRLCDTDPDREMATKMLYDARPPRLFDYGSNFELTVNRLVKVFKTAKPVESEKPPAELTSHVGERIARRCGRVYSDTYDKDRYYITLDNVTRKVQKNTDITSLFVRRSVFHAFWGWKDDQGNEQGNDQDDKENDDWDDIMDDLVPDLGERHQSQPGQAVASEDQEMRDAAASVEPRRRHQGKMREQKGLQRHRQQDMAVARAKPRETPLKQRRQRIQQVITSSSSQGALPEQRRQQAQQALIAATSQEQQPEQRQQQVQQTLITANARHEEERPASTSSALTTFVSGPSPSVPQNPWVTIHLRENGDWFSQDYRRQHLEDGIAQMRQRDPSRILYLFNIRGRGIVLEDCYNEDDICLSENQDGFPLDIIL
ncbi:hypothetical protein F5Y09DRAFT_327003 [Xylaria sp. FL1042]|nr:hypothetical protein F5Y09DRAFT_327003 [Xylaria sp. FL1042]